MGQGGRLIGGAERVNLDRRQAVLAVFFAMAEAARAAGVPAAPAPPAPAPAPPVPGGRAEP